MFGKKLKEILDRKGITIYKLSKETGINKQTISNYIDGKNSPTIEKAIKIACFLNISLDSLLNSTKLSTRESDDFLYHFTNNYEGFMNILNGKIKPQYSIEDISFIIKEIDEGINLKPQSEKLAYPIFCLCDIPYERLSIHQEKYGKYGIGFKKEWASKNRLNTITYVSKGSRTAYSISCLISFLLKIRAENKEKNKQDKEFDSAFNGLNNLFMMFKLYEQDGFRYYDEKEWRWIPDSHDIPLALACPNDAKKEDLKKYQECINSNPNIAIDFDLDDIANIIIPKEERSRFVEDVKKIYEKPADIEKIESLVYEGSCDNSKKEALYENKQSIGQLQSELNHAKEELIKLRGQNELLERLVGLKQYEEERAKNAKKKTTKSA